MTFREKILDLIRAKPGISESEIAAALDCDMDEIYPSIRAECASHQVLVEKGDDRHTPFAYSMNPAYLGWKAPQKEVEVPKFSKATPEKLVAKAAAAPDNEISKVDKALAHLREHGRATNEELKEAMGLEKMHVPSQFLGSALRRGLVKRDGKDWLLADSASAPATEPPPAQPTRPEPTRSTSRQLPQYGVVSSLKIGDLQIIHWDSGNLKISANDNTIDLTAQQAKALRAFVELT